MTIEELNDFFSRDHDGHDHTDGWKYVQGRRASRRDLHAMLLIDALLPAASFGEDVVSASQHDQFWVFPDPHQLAPHLTEETCLELLRCGLCYQEGEGFYFFA